MRVVVIVSVAMIMGMAVIFVMVVAVISMMVVIVIMPLVMVMIVAMIMLLLFQMHIEIIGVNAAFLRPAKVQVISAPSFRSSPMPSRTPVLSSKSLSFSMPSFSAPGIEPSEGLDAEVSAVSGTLDALVVFFTSSFEPHAVRNTNTKARHMAVKTCLHFFIMTTPF